MDALIRSGLKIQRLGRDLRTPLHEAARNPTSPALENVKFLLEKGDDINARDHDNNTPLLLTLSDDVTAAKLAAAKFLLANGANPNQRNSNDQTPLDLVRNQKTYTERYGPEPNRSLISEMDQLIALLTKVTVTPPQRRVFGETRLADGTLINATVFLSDADEPHARLGWMEIKKDGKFEFKVREGQRFRISALYPGAKDWKHLQFHTSMKSLTTFFTVKGDLGPIIITLERSATRP